MRLKTANNGRIYLYKVTWGASVDLKSKYMRADCFRAIKDDLDNIMGMHIPFENYIYSTQFIEEPWTQYASAKGQQHEMQIGFLLAIDLDDLNEQSKPHLNQILYYFNNIVKRALRQKKYNQIGRFPKFFHLDDKQKINQHRLDAWPGYECQSMLAT